MRAHRMLVTCALLMIVPVYATQQQHSLPDSSLEEAWARGWAAFRDGDLEGAAAHQRRCLVRAEELGDLKAQAKCVSQLSYYARALGDFDLGLTTAEHARQLYERTPQDRYEGWMTMGNAYAALNDGQRAGEAFDRADALQDGRQDGLLLLLAGEQYERAGDLETAVDRYLRSAQLSDRHNNPPRRLQPRARAAAAYAQLGRRGQSEAMMAEVHALQKELGVPAGPLVHRFLGLAAGTLGDRQAAAAHLDKAATFPAARTLEGLRDLGHAYRRVGLPGKAVACYAAALALAEKTPSPLQLARMRAFRAHASHDAGMWEEALSDINDALPEFERARASIARPQMRAEYFATLHRHYELKIDVLMHLHEGAPHSGFAEQAFAVAEHARARSLREHLVHSLAQTQSGADPQLLREEQRLRVQLAALLDRREKASNPTPSPMDPSFDVHRARKFTRELEELQHRYDAVAGRIERGSQRLTDGVAPAPAALRSVQQRLAPGALILEFSLGEHHSYLFVVDRVSLTAFELPERQAIENRARALHALLRTRPASTMRPTATALARALDELNKATLGNVALPPARRVAVAAEGALQYVPFELLPSLASAEVTYLPSASVLTVQRQSAPEIRAGGKRVAIFADPVFSAADSRVKPSAAASSGAPDELPRLPFSRREAQAVAASFPGSLTDLVTDFAAAKGALLKLDHRVYGVLHLATHGLIDTTDPLGSRLVLSQVDRSGRRRDGLLTLPDIYSLRISADIVVLSACDTALGREVRGEGMIGLTRGFLHAGSRRVVASLWKVDDAATSELMKYFYQALQAPDTTPSSALQRAQRRLRANSRWSHPYFWAGFQVHGDW